MTFQISIEPSGRTFSAEPNEVILAAAIAQGIGLPYGCKDGACGSCKCKLLSGQVVHGAHQDKALGADEKTQGFVLTCCAKPLSSVVLESKQVMAEGVFLVKKMPVRVSSLAKVSHDVAIVKLQMPATEPFKYHAGQYVEFLLRDGDRRSYSMANAPHLQGSPAHIELHIRHMQGGKFTDHVFGSMKEKDILRIEGPYGSFYLREDSIKPMIFLASGTGFAPIKALIEQLQHIGSKRPVVVYWGARRPQDLYLHEWMQAHANSLPHISYVPVVSDAQASDDWQGRTGFVHQAVLLGFPDLSQHQVYACGAPVVIESALRDFVQQANLPENEFFADAFTSAADKLTG